MNATTYNNLQMSQLNYKAAMNDPSGLRRLYYAYLSRMYAFAYFARERRFLGIRLSTWLWLIPLAVLIYGWWQNWPAMALFPFIVFILWLAGSFWAARRANYMRFVANGVPLMAASSLSPLSSEQEVELFATGAFGLSSRQNNVLLQPATYWRVPLGEHVIMVQEQPGRFLYQFFDATTLQTVSEGWLLFGSEPRDALAVEFLANWGPAFTKFALYEDGKEANSSTGSQTVYLTFNSEADRRAVWHTIVSDARDARSAASSVDS